MIDTLDEAATRGTAQNKGKNWTDDATNSVCGESG